MFSYRFKWGKISVTPSNVLFPWIKLKTITVLDEMFTCFVNHSLLYKVWGLEVEGECCILGWRELVWGFSSLVCVSSKIIASTQWSFNPVFISADQVVLGMNFQHEVIWINPFRTRNSLSCYKIRLAVLFVVVLDDTAHKIGCENSWC